MNIRKMSLGRVALYWLITFFMVSYFGVAGAQVGATAQACVPNPTNYLYKAVSKPVPVNEANVVPVVDERAPVVERSVFDEGFDYGKSLWQDWKPASDTVGPKTVLAVIAFFVIILAVTAYVIYKLIKLLDKVIPPPEPPAPPPSSPTNSPPVVINPGQSPGPALTGLTGSRTKTITQNPNRPVFGPKDYDGDVSYYNITAWNIKNTMERFSVALVFDHFWSVSIDVTTNMVDWDDSHYRVDAYVCTPASGVFYAYYHYDTNYYNCYYTGSYVTTNHVAPAYFDLTDKYESHQFFRLSPK